MHSRELREFANHVVRRMEQDTGVGLAKHGGVVIRVTRRDHAIVEALEGEDRLTLGVLLAQLVIHYAIRFIGDQLVA